MPSLLGRFVGLSFRTELLIMNIFGLVNSTLDWSPLKWTNKLEQIWNLSIPQKSLIVDTIGEDTIKTILSWIVITRIVIAHVYTFTYLSNIYPIITWSRPNLLLPWLILSFFKNVVLEVVVIVIGLLLWYGSPFSLVVFLEFIFIKFVPLVMASYNWYSNSRLFLQLRHTEKMRKLHRSMRSDSNLLTNQLYVKIDEPRYRTGSLTTLFSYDSCETYNPGLTPGENAKKLLGITEQDVADALERIKEREAHKRLTELDDDNGLVGDRSASKGYFIGSSIYTGDIFVHNTSAINQEKLKNLEDLENAKDEDNFETAEDPEDHSVLNIIHKSPTDKYEDAFSVQEELKAVNLYTDVPETVEKLGNPTSNNPKNIEKEDTVVANVSTEVLESKKRDESSELVESQKTKQRRSGSPVQEKDIEPTTWSEEETKVDLIEDDVRSEKRTPNSEDSQAVFNCNCVRAKSAVRGSHADTDKPADMTTSTPRGYSDNDEEKQPPENSTNSTDQPYSHVYSVTEVKTNSAMNSGFPLMEKVLKNNLEILKSMKVDERCQKSAFSDAQDFRKVQEDRSNIFLDGYGGHLNATVDVQDISDIVKDLGVSMNRLTIDTSRSENATPRSDVSPTEREISKLNVPERSSNKPNPPRFYQDFLKVFDGCYQNDFANNSELQCVFQQMEKKKWNLFSGQTNLETLLTTGFPEQSNEADEPPWCDSSESMSRRSVRTEDSESPMKEAACRPPEKNLPEIEDFLKPITMKSTKNVGTQTMDAKIRWRYFSRRNRSQHQRGSGSQVSNTKLAVGKKGSSSNFWRMRSNSPHASKSPPNDSRKPNGPKYFSNRSDCECKMTERKYSPSTDSSFDKREDKHKALGKLKVNSLATLPLAQVTRRTEANALPFRIKPPVYPKKNKKEAPMASAVDKSWKSYTGKGTEQTESKKSIDSQSTSSSKRTTRSQNWSRKKKEELAAQELRALKAYNEITLLEDKKKLDAKRRTLERLASDRDGRGSHKRTFAKRDVGKENLSADSTNATNSSSRSNKPPLIAAGKSGSVSHGKHSNPKSSKIAKPVDKQENLDRLLAMDWINQSRREQQNNSFKNVATREAGKISLMYASRNYEMSNAAIPLGTSDMKLEGVETGRDLERSKAKEDVRSAALSAKADAERAESTGQNQFSRADAGGLEPEDKELLTLVKKTAREDAASTRSSSSDDLENATTGSSHEQQGQDLPRVEEEGIEVLEDLGSTSDGISEKEELTERRIKDSENPESVERRNEDVGSVRQDNSVVPWEEPVSVTSTMLHNLLSFRLIDSVLKPPSQFILNDDRVEEFSASCRAIVPVIPETQNLGQAEKPMTVGKVAVDQKIAAANLETEGRIDGLDDDQVINLSKEQLDDILGSVTEVLKNLNILENAENLSETQDKITDNEEKLKEDDIFTSIKFPIIIKTAEISPDLLGTLDVLLSPLLVDRNVELEEPLGPNVTGLTVITEENEEANTSSQDVKTDLNRTYDILKGCSDDDTGVRIEEVDEDDQNSETYDSEMSKVDTSIDLEKLEDDRSETSDSALEEIIARLVRSATIDVEEFEEEQVQDEQPKEKRTEVDSESDAADDSTRDEELVEDSVDEGIDELPDRDAESSAGEEQICLVEIVSSSQLKESETVLQKAEELEDAGCRSVAEQTFEQSYEDDGAVRKLDKHEQEEKIATGVCKEGIRTTEAEDSATVEDVTSIIDIDRSSSSMDKREAKEQNVGLLKSNENAEKREQPEEPGPTDTTVAGADEKVSLKIIFMFFLQVWFFYIRHFYRRICSFAQTSRATSALKPFEVHTVSTSTSTLIEKAGLVEKVQEESLVEENGETFETMNISRVIEERLQGVLDLTAERCTSRNSDFETEEMTVALRRETEELGLSSSAFFTEEITRVESLGLEKQTEEVQTISLRSEPSSNDGQVERDAGEVQDTVRERELSLTVDVGKDEGSSKDGQTVNEEAKGSVEETEDASVVQFETTLEDMDSFNSIYIVSSKTPSCSELDDDDDMEEFSAVSSTSGESPQ